MRWIAVLSALTLAVAAAGANWPQWRGPGASGVSEQEGLPLNWSPQRNIAWKVELPGRGLSQPVIWGSRLFLTTAIEGEIIPGAAAIKHRIDGQDFLHPDSVGADRKQTLKVLCYDARSGKLLWERTAYEGKAYDNRHKRNSYASPTIVTDGKLVIAHFESMGVYGYSLTGKLLWKASLGGIASVGMGPGSSPVLAGDLVILQCDQDEGANSFLVALAKRDGREVWRTPRKVQASWATPVLAGSELIASGNESIIAYDPKTGKEMWSVPGLQSHAIHTPMIAGGMVIVTSGFPVKRSFGLRLGAAAERVAWKYEKGTAYVPTGIVYRGLLYLLTDGGIMTCLDPATGQPVYEGKRLPAPARFMASPVAAGGRIYLTSEEGDTYVVKAGREHEVLATNPIGEAVTASMAIAGDSFYLRAAGHLYRIRADAR